MDYAELTADDVAAQLRQRLRTYEMRHLDSTLDAEVADALGEQAGAEAARTRAAGYALCIAQTLARLGGME